MVRYIHLESMVTILGHGSDFNNLSTLDIVLCISLVIIVVKYRGYESGLLLNLEVVIILAPSIWNRLPFK